MATRQQMDETDRTLLNILQSRFPLMEEPYANLAKELDLNENALIERISKLKKSNILRQISAIFDTRRLGYKTTLAAFRYPPELLDRGARRINQHPGVSHNYARNGHFNLWFTIAVPPHKDLETTINNLAHETNAETYRVMPTIRFFKIGVNFDMTTTRGAAVDYYSPDGYGDNPKSESHQVQKDWNRPEELTQFEIQAIRELQEDLPLTSYPFSMMAERLQITQQEFFKLANDFQKRGLMRRYSAVLHHRKAGFKANAMAVWKVPEDRAEEVGLLMAKNPWVTHCYQRPTFPDWEFTHFTMIHAATKTECSKVVEDIGDITGITEKQLLYSTREYKKTRVRYFVEDETELL
jgi:DNA-binding Lrp family transcriptional regulator